MPFLQPSPTIRRESRGFTILELLIVVVIIGILVAAIVGASTVFITDSRVKNTRTVLIVVRDALEQFKEEKPPITNIIQGERSDPRTPTYLKRYGLYPPDELDVYGPTGLPGATPTAGYPLVGRGKGLIHPPIEGGTVMAKRMRFYTNSIFEKDALEHRDIAAMMLTLDLFSESASSMLARIPNRNWSPGALDKDGKPAQFLDRNANLNWDADTDQQIRYPLDDWGFPLAYMSQRDWVANVTMQTPQAAVSTNHSVYWNRASTEMVRLNGGHPIIFSWGPDSKNQLTEQEMKDSAQASLVRDWIDNDKIAHPLNADNVYADEGLAAKLAKGN